MAIFRNVFKKKNIILIDKEKNPKLYKAILQRGGTIKISSVIMTINKKNISLVTKIRKKIETILQVKK